MISREALARIGAKILSAIDAMADKAFALPTRRRKTMSANDVIGPRAVADLVGTSVTPTIIMIVLALAVISLFWFIAKIGLWLFLAAVWAVMITIVYRLRSRIVLSRVAEAVRRREEEYDGKGDDARGDERP